MLVVEARVHDLLILPVSCPAYPLPLGPTVDKMLERLTALEDKILAQKEEEEEAAKRPSK